MREQDNSAPSEESRDYALAEYKALQGDAQTYRHQRNIVMAVVVAGVGSLLGLSGTQSAGTVILGVFAILVGGASITWECTYQAHRREAYISAVIERSKRQLNWFTLAPLSRKYTLFGRWRLDNERIPQSYPCVYVGLGLVGLVYGIGQSVKARVFLPVLLAMVGFVVLMVIVYCLQREGLNSSYQAKVREWLELINNEIEQSL